MKSKIKYIIIGIVAALIIICGITTITVNNRLKTYKVNTLYEDLTPVEKIVSKVSGTKFYTKDEAIEKGLVLSDEKKASEEVSNTFKTISDYIVTSDAEKTDIKIAECEDALLDLQKFINSDKCNTDNLKDYTYACIETVTSYKSQLECYKGLDASMYKYYSDKTINKFKEVNTCLDNIK